MARVPSTPTTSPEDTDPDIRQYDDLLQPVPWLTWADAPGFALRSSIDEMLTPNTRQAVPDDPWAGGPSN